LGENKVSLDVEPRKTFFEERVEYILCRKKKTQQCWILGVYCKILNGNTWGGGSPQGCICIWVNPTAHFKVKGDLFFPLSSLHMQQRFPSLEMQVLTGWFPLPCLMSRLECEIVWNDLLLTLPTYPFTNTSVPCCFTQRTVIATS